MMRGVTIIIRLRGVAAGADVVEQAVEVGNLVQNRHAVLQPLLRSEPLDAAQEHGAAVGHADRGRNRGKGEGGQLHRGALILGRRAALAGGCRVAGAVGAAASWCSTTNPVNVNVLTAPIELKNGTTVNRTNRRSLETTACTDRNVPDREHHDHRLLGGGKVAHDRNHADHERALGRVRHEGLLAIEQRDLGRLQDIRCASRTARHCMKK